MFIVSNQVEASSVVVVVGLELLNKFTLTTNVGSQDEMFQQVFYFKPLLLVEVIKDV